MTFLLISPEQVEVDAIRFASSPVSKLLPHTMAAWAVAGGERVTITGLVFGASYLLAHGLVKIVLVMTLLRNQLWAYPWMIAILAGFVIFQCYELSHGVPAGLAALTAFDVAVIVLTWREYHRQRKRHHSATDSMHIVTDNRAQVRLSIGPPS